MHDIFKRYMDALAEVLHQELPDVADARAEFAIDGIPYVITADADAPAIFVCAVIGALPEDEAPRTRLFADMLHAQFCFSESCGFTFGVDADDTFVLLQSLVNPECEDERHFVERMEKFVQTANVWSKRIALSASAEAAAARNRRRSWKTSRSSTTTLSGSMVKRTS